MALTMLILHFPLSRVFFVLLVAPNHVRSRSSMDPKREGITPKAPWFSFLVALCNIPNFQFGMLYIRSSCITYFIAFFCDPRDSMQLKDPRRELGISLFHIWVFSNFENRIICFNYFLSKNISYQIYERG